MEEFLPELQRLRDEAAEGPEWVEVPRLDASTCDSETFATILADSVSGSVAVVAGATASGARATAGEGT